MRPDVPMTGMRCLGSAPLSVEIPECSVSPEFADSLLRECLSSCTHAWLTVTGDCMEPDLCSGDRVVLADPARRPPRVGDLVLVRLPAGLRLHRLIWGPPLAPRFARWRTKSDRADVWDPPVSPDRILGSVAAIEGLPEHGSGRRPVRALRSLARALWTRIRLAGPGRKPR
jgi:hypothetical protein